MSAAMEVHGAGHREGIISSKRSGQELLRWSKVLANQHVHSRSGDPGRPPSCLRGADGRGSRPRRFRKQANVAPVVTGCGAAQSGHRASSVSPSRKRHPELKKSTFGPPGGSREVYQNLGPKSTASCPTFRGWNRLKIIQHQLAGQISVVRTNAQEVLLKAYGGGGAPCRWKRVEHPWALGFSCCLAPVVISRLTCKDFARTGPVTTGECRRAYCRLQKLIGPLQPRAARSRIASVVPALPAPLAQMFRPGISGAWSLVAATTGTRIGRRYANFSWRSRCRQATTKRPSFLN